MKKVIFDLDGTLYQTHITFLKAVELTLDEYGLPPAPEAELTKIIGKAVDEFLKGMLPSAIPFDEFRQRLRFHEYNAVREHGRLFPGVPEMLEELKRQGFQLFICSNGSAEYLELVSQSTGIKQYFTDIISTKQRLTKKDAINQIAEENDFTIMVGDTSTDFIGAREAGIPSLAVTYGYGSEEECSQAVYLADTTTEVFNTVILAAESRSVNRSIC
jgi:phosphoglycolate phosphatase